MRKLGFKKSRAGSIGVELELQLIDPPSSSLASRSKELIRNIKTGPYNNHIFPEITQSMIEINSSIHQSTQTMQDEFSELKVYLSEEASDLNIAICGGGTHPFQTWAMQKIFPTTRYKSISHRFRFLSKLATVFGQHIHIGCANSEDALYLTHALARYVPQFIALTASSPFYQGVDTGFSSSRYTAFNVFPTSGVIPYLISWVEFAEYFYRMREMGIINSMKDVYWDIRPKPEFGTVEIRVCDTPLTLKTALQIAAYVQSLSVYLLEERSNSICHDLYYLYNNNRFEASRYGFSGHFINPYTRKKCLIVEDIFKTAKEIAPYTQQLGNTGYVSQLLDRAAHGINDSVLLRALFKRLRGLHHVVAEQCKVWAGTL